MKEDGLQKTAAEIERHLNEIAPLFKPGMKLTFIARMPGNNEADLLMTIDDLEQIKAVIERRQQATN